MAQLSSYRPEGSSSLRVYPSSPAPCNVVLPPVCGGLGTAHTYACHLEVPTGGTLRFSLDAMKLSRPMLVLENTVVYPHLRGSTRSVPYTHDRGRDGQHQHQATSITIPVCSSIFGENRSPKIRGEKFSLAVVK